MNFSHPGPELLGRDQLRRKPPNTPGAVGAGHKSAGRSVSATFLDGCSQPKVGEARVISVRDQDIVTSQISMHDIHGMKVIEARSDLESLELWFQHHSPNICALLTSRATSSLPRSARYFKIVPYFIQGDTIQSDAGNVWRSIPRNGRMKGAELAIGAPPCRISGQEIN
jgi:hypothetical protein